jgi:hypothetical protein
MSLVTPTLNLPAAPASIAGPAKPAAAPPMPAAVATPTKAPDAPSTTVTLSAQAQSVMNAANHPGAPSPTSAAAPAPPDSSVYESLKNGIASAVTDVGDAIEDGAQAVVDGVETTLSTVNTAVKGLLGLPFAAVAKVCDAAGAIIDKA